MTPTVIPADSAEVTTIDNCANGTVVELVDVVYRNDRKAAGFVKTGRRFTVAPKRLQPSDALVAVYPDDASGLVLGLPQEQYVFLCPDSAVYGFSVTVQVPAGVSRPRAAELLRAVWESGWAEHHMAFDRGSELSNDLMIAKMKLFDVE
jgi:hypothetical protein